jgi:hypothetical protein
MVRPTKIASELEEMILVRVRDQTACPADLQVRVIRVDGKWDAFSELIDKEKHPHCLARVLLAAKELRTRYDLAE